MKKLFLIFTFFMTSNLIIADDHEVKIESDGTVAEFNYFSVTNPVAFVNSLNMFDKSQCAKKWSWDEPTCQSLIKSSQDESFL